MSSATKTPMGTPKTMSSRLMTMKFMQRAAASTTSPAGQTKFQNAAPRDPSPSTEPPPKRRKDGSHKISSRNAAPVALAAQSDLELVREALEIEEAKREKALDRLAEEAGETKWVLDPVRENDDRKRGNRIHIIRAGYGEIDQGRAGERYGTCGTEGRMSFGRSKHIAKNPSSPTEGPDQTPSDSDSDMASASSDEDASNISMPDSAHTTQEKPFRSAEIEGARQAKAKRKAAQKARRMQNAKSATLVEKRRMKEVKLNTLSSISGGRPDGSKAHNKECYRCGQKGHEKRNCPQASRQSVQEG